MAKRRKSRNPDSVAYQVGPGTVVAFGYEIYDAEGDLVEASPPNEPMVFLCGYGELSSPLEHALEGLSVGQVRRVRLSPEEAFGPRDPSLIIEVDRSELPACVAPGDELDADREDGSVATLKVLEVGPDHVVLDTNPMLAGQTIEIDVVVEAVRPATAREISEAAARLEQGGEPAPAAPAKPGSLDSRLLPADSLLRRGHRRYEGPTGGGANGRPSPHRVA